MKSKLKNRLRNVDITQAFGHGVQRRRLHVERLEKRILLNADLAWDLAIERDGYDPTSILVRYRDRSMPVSLPAGTSIAKSFGSVQGLQKIQLSAGINVADALAAYRADPNVLYAEPDYRIRLASAPNDPMYDQLWGLDNTGQTGGTADADIDAPAAWDVSTGSGGTVVAVIDTGVDYTHEDLAANIWVNPLEANGTAGVDDDGNGFIDDIHGYDFANDDGDPMDDNNHGTHVAGTIGAVGNNGIGVAGVNWNVQIMAVKFLAADGTGSTSGAVDAINYAVAQGATISNSSWGGNEPFSQALYDSIAAARDQDHIFVAGAGNGFYGIPLNNDSWPFYPASYDLDNIVAVAATDHNNQLASFSNYGAVSVDLAAPGVDILSTTPGNTYSLFSGTSMATPHVAGVIALVRDQFPQLDYREAISLVLDNVVPNPALQDVTVTGGQLNAARAVPSQNPEISVRSVGEEIVDGGTFDFGTTLIGVPLSQEFTIKNVGVQDLVLGDQVGVPAGFTLVSPWTGGTLGFGAEATFTLQMNVDALGTRTGEVSLSSNDDDENPFNFSISGEVSASRILDNDDAEVSYVGSWGLHTDPPGALDNEFRYIAPGVGNNLAEWQFTVQSGQYEVWASWSASGNRATNSPYTVLDNSLALDTALLNQQGTANDLIDAGAGWESLGTHLIAGDTLRVQLTDDADGYVIADGIRIERVGDLQPEPDAQASLDGSLISVDAHVDFGSVFPGAVASKTISVRNVGQQTLTLGEITVPLGFSASSGFSATQLEPGETATVTVAMDTSQLASLNGEISFETNDPDADPFRFQVGGSVTSVRIIDNNEDGFAFLGDWASYHDPPGALNSTFLYSAAGSGADEATWTFDVAPGQYQVSVSWSASSNRATNSPFTITDGSTTFDPILINQQLVPDDLSDVGVDWEDLGAAYQLSGPTLVVKLGDNANNFVIADAVRVQRLDLPPSPDIEVSADGQPLVDGLSVIGFGPTLLGSPIARTFQVTNVGEADLILDGAIGAPPGFSVTAGLGQTTLGPAQSTSFTVQIDASTAGSFSGEISLGTNDGDEDPFDFHVQGDVASALIMDNGDEGFSVDGNWTSWNGEGFQSDIHYSASGVGDDIATWTFPVSPGRYAAAATWFAASNRATDAPFLVLDGGYVVAATDVNQEQTPGDFVDQGVGWKTLAEFNVTGNSVVIQLTDDANEFVIADAVRIERLADPPTGGEIEVTADGAGLIDDVSTVDFGATLAGLPVSKTFTVRNAGGGTLSLGTSVTVPDGFQLVSGFGATDLAPGETTTFTVRFDATDEGTFGGDLLFTSNDEDESPFNVALSASATAVQVLDNGDNGFSTTGNWTHWAGEGFQNDIHYSAAGNGQDTSSWTFGVSPGQYIVAATWNALANRASDTPFTVFDDSFQLGAVRIDQQLPPNDFIDQGVGWETLGQFAVVSDTLTVQLNDDANEYVIADAIRVQRVGDLAAGPDIEVYLETLPVSADGGIVDFGSALSGSPVTKTFVVRNVGQQDLHLGSEITAPAGFTVVEGFSSVIVAPGGQSTFDIRLDAAANGEYSGDIAFATDVPSENPFTFQIAGDVIGVQIIDNGEAGFTVSGNWGTHSQPPGALNGLFHYSAAGSGFDVATWTFDVTAGEYRVSASWSASSNRASDAKYVVLDGATDLATVEVNQKIPTDDFSDAGVFWEDLGTFPVVGSTLAVRLADNANNFVIADAIRIERIPVSGGPAVLSYGNEGIPAVVEQTSPLFVLVAERPSPPVIISTPPDFEPVRPVTDYVYAVSRTQKRLSAKVPRDRVWSEHEDWLLDGENLHPLWSALSSDP